MTDAPTLAEKIFSMLDESARTSTYKPALLLALMDRAQEHLSDGRVPVRALAERVIELYWPQTRPYPKHGVLLQNQGGQAKIVRTVEQFRATTGSDLRFLPVGFRCGAEWEKTVTNVERTLAEWPIPRLQRPLNPFLYDFDWTWEEDRGWAVSRYDRSSRSLALFDGVPQGLVTLGPLLRPFITRWWTDKAAQLNPNVEAAQALHEFEDFLFKTERKQLDPVGNSLLDLQHGRCFYCGTGVGKQREIDHFIAWARSGDDGLDNLVAACRRCNNSKRAVLAGGEHLAALLERNRRWDSDLAAIAVEKQWLRNPGRSDGARRSAYLVGPTDRPLWHWNPQGREYILTTLAAEADGIRRMLVPT